jgi:hypothetical protein
LSVRLTTADSPKCINSTLVKPLLEAAERVSGVSERSAGIWDVAQVGSQRQQIEFGFDIPGPSPGAASSLSISVYSELGDVVGRCGREVGVGSGHFLATFVCIFHGRRSAELVHRRTPLALYHMCVVVDHPL